MFKGKKVISLVVATVFTLGIVLSGCGQKATTDSTTSTVAAGSSEQAAQTTEQQKLEPVKLKYYMPAAPQKAEAQAAIQAEVNKLLKEKINAEIELNLIDWGVWFEKYPVILSSGEQADLMFSACWSGYTAEAAKNSFLEVSDLLKQYGQGITSTLGEEFLMSAKVQGKLFAVPENKDAAQGYALYLQKDILEKSGVKAEAIKSLEDMEPILEYVKNNEKNLIPAATTFDVGGMYMCTRDGFADGVGDFSKLEMGYDQWYGVIAYDKTEDKFKSLDPSVTKAWMSYAKLMNKFNKKGYFMKDLLTNKSIDAGKLWQDGKTWFTTSSDVPGQLELIQGNVKKEVVQIPMVPAIKNTNTLTGSLTTIPRAAVDPARSMMVINLLHSDKDLLNLVTNGIEGKNYVKGADNTIKLPEGFKAKPDTGWDPNFWWMIGNAFLNHVWDTDLPNRWDKIQEYNKQAPVSAIVGFSFDSTNVKSEVASVNNVWEQYKRLIFTGSGNTEKYVTDMFTKMKASGLDKVVDEYNKQLQTWKAAK